MQHNQHVIKHDSDNAQSMASPGDAADNVAKKFPFECPLLKQETWPVRFPRKQRGERKGKFGGDMKEEVKGEASNAKTLGKAVKNQEIIVSEEGNSTKG